VRLLLSAVSLVFGPLLGLDEVSEGLVTKITEALALNQKRVEPYHIPKTPASLTGSGS
jgi:hypothetical protein